MQIDVEPRDLGSVVQLVAKEGGWKPEETRYSLKPFYIGGYGAVSEYNQTPKRLIEPLQAAWLTTREKRQNDHNGLKVAVTRLAVTDGVLSTEAVVTDYFTAWGLPKADASKDLFAEHERQVIINRVTTPNAAYETDIPWALCTHNILLDRNGDVLMMVRSQSQGFNAGRVSVTEEEQMEPRVDYSPFAASFRSFAEELYSLALPQSIRLLGVAMEKGAAYPAYAFIAETDNKTKIVVENWREATDNKENTALLAIPMTKIDEWLKSEITPNIWNKYLLAGDISPDAILKLHATSPWRLELARKYTKAA